MNVVLFTMASSVLYTFKVAPLTSTSAEAFRSEFPSLSNEVFMVPQDPVAERVRAVIAGRPDLQKVCLCIADNCFCAALFMTSQGRGLPIPWNVGMHREPATRHHAMRVFFRNMVTQAWFPNDKFVHWNHHALVLPPHCPVGVQVCLPAGVHRSIGKGFQAPALVWIDLCECAPFCSAASQAMTNVLFFVSASTQVAKGTIDELTDPLKWPKGMYAGIAFCCSLLVASQGYPERSLVRLKLPTSSFPSPS
jgi:hypothetical protein